MSDYCIYRHIRLDTNKVFYIGIGSLKRPYCKHNRSKYWNNIINKTNYEIQILKSNLSWEDAVELEIILISYYGRKDLNTGTLVNLTDGGEGTINIIRKPVSIDTRKKLSIIKKGFKHSEETKKKISEIQKGKKLSQETCDKMSNARKGVLKSKETCLKIKNNNFNSKKIIDTNTNIVYISIIEASKKLNINYGKLKSDLRGRTKNKTTLKYLNYE